MIVNTLKVVFEIGDLQRAVSKLAGGIDKLKELKVALENGRVVLSGRIALGLTIPFTTRWQARVLDEGRAAGLTLAGVSVGMAGMGEELITVQVLKLLESRLQGYDAIRLEGREIIVELQPALALQGIRLTAPLKKVEISGSGILLEL